MSPCLLTHSLSAAPISQSVPSSLTLLCPIIRPSRVSSVSCRGIVVHSVRRQGGRRSDREGGQFVRSSATQPNDLASELSLQCALRPLPHAPHARSSLSALCLSACAHCAPTEQARQLKKRRSTASFPLPPQQSHQSPAKRACEKCRAGASDDRWLRTQNRTSAAVTSECTMSQLQPSPSSAVVDHRHRRRC